MMDARADNPRAVAGDNRPPTFREEMSEKYGSVFAALEPLADMADEAPEKITGPDELDRASNIVRDCRKLWKEIDEARDKEKRPHLDAEREIDAFFKTRMAAVKRVQDTMQARADAYQAEVDRLARAKALAEARAAEAEAKRQSDLAAAEAARNRPQAAATHMRKSEEMATRAEEALFAQQASAADVTRIRSEGGTTSATTEWLFEITDYQSIDLNVLRAYIPRERIEMAIKALLKVHKNTVPVAGVRIFQKTKAVIR